ncbi:hypothetical protein AcW1_003970 [Taiwanofungus camphoratus]|nr:hypothetical protein AcW1_003970 [Antrodia cinnamomea]
MVLSKLCVWPDWPPVTINGGRCEHVLNTLYLQLYSTCLSLPPLYFSATTIRASRSVSCLKMSGGDIQTVPSFSLAFECLSIEEILAEVINHLFNRGKGSSSLLNLACTCQTFRDPCLNLMWNRSTSLTRLFSVLPKESREFFKRGSATGKTEFILRRRRLLFKYSDFDRWFFYARRIKHFWWTGQSQLTVQSIHNFCDGIMPGLRPFPEVVTLTWLDPRPEMFRCICLFLSPKLQKMRITGNDDVPLLPIMFQVMQEGCPALKSIVVDFHPSYDNFEFELYVLILEHKTQLEELDIPRPFSARSVMLLSSMPKLERVRLSMNVEEQSSLPLRDIQGAFFPVLKVLKLAVRVLDSQTLLFLKNIQSEELSEIWLASMENPTSSMLREHFTAIAQSSFSGALRCLSFEIYPSTRDNTQVTNHRNSELTITIDTLHPLLRLRKLRKLVVGSRTLRLNDAALADIASAFPRLQELTLAPHFALRKPDVCEMTLAGLRHLSAGCPELHALDIRLDASIVPSPPPADRPSSQSALQNLNVDDSDVGDPPFVVSTLRSMFPSLKECLHWTNLIDMDDFTPEEWEAYQTYCRWQEVNRLLKLPTPPGDHAELFNWGL